MLVFHFSGSLSCYTRLEQISAAKPVDKVLGQFINSIYSHRLCGGFLLYRESNNDGANMTWLKTIQN